MKKVLFVATVVKKHINVFHLPYLKWFKENGYETHVCAANDFENKEDLFIPYCDKYHELPFERSPFKMKNFDLYKQLRKIIFENNYDIIHCHTPMGGVLTRLAARRSRESGTKVIYTAHGFHFYKGAPLKNWLTYYLVEKWLSKHTDCLITINSEDYEIAMEKFKAKTVKLINGVGINIKEFSPPTQEYKIKLRYENGFKDNEFLLIYVGELSYRKHQDFLIKTVQQIADKLPDIKLLLVGSGQFINEYKQLVDSLGIEDKVNFLGFRNDINKLMSLSDMAVSSSRQEGLPVNIMEAMATGLPVIVTNCRGNRDLIVGGDNGEIVEIGDIEGFTNAIEKLYKSRSIRNKYSQNNLESIKQYSLEKVLEEMGKVYSNL